MARSQREIATGGERNLEVVQPVLVMASGCDEPGALDLRGGAPTVSISRANRVPEQVLRELAGVAALA